MTELKPLPGVYIIRNRYTGARYLGSAHNLKKRWYLHVYNLERGKHHSPALQRAWNKYGAEGFECFALGYYPKERVLEEETWWLQQLKLKYNTCRIGRSRAGVRNRPEHNAAIAEKARLRWADPAFKARMRVVLSEAQKRARRRCQ